MTYTFALLMVSASTYDEVERLLRAADYDHCFGHADGAIDMHGIGLVREPEKEIQLADVFEGAADGAVLSDVNIEVAVS